MTWLIYNILFAIGYTLMMPHFLIRMCRRGGYAKNFFQRLGDYDPAVRDRIQSRKRIWVHAVSVGEIYVAFSLMKEMREADPGIAFIVTTTTSTGHKIAEEKLHEDDVLLYYPTDFPSVVKKALDVLRPEALILTESEIWPNMVRLAKARRIPIVLFNGRISESSFKGYKLIRLFFSKVLRCISLFLVQSDADKDRLVELGADKDSVRVLWSTKYDVAEFDPARAQKVVSFLDSIGFSAGSNIIVGGSTWIGEEDALLDIFKTLKKSMADLKLVLVPRHAERRAEVESEIKKHDLKYIKRTDFLSLESTEALTDKPDVLLADTTGELMDFYSAATVIFVGKSLTNHGGQNIIEPASIGKPVVIGPNMENFPVVVSDFLSADAMIQVQDKNGLADALKLLLESKEKREGYGQRAKDVVQTRKGVIAQSVKLVREAVGS